MQAAAVGAGEVVEGDEPVDAGTDARSHCSADHFPMKYHDEEIVKNDVAEHVGKGEIKSQLRFLGSYQYALESIAYNHNRQEEEKGSAIGQAIFHDTGGSANQLAYLRQEDETHNCQSDTDGESCFDEHGENLPGVGSPG